MPQLPQGVVFVVQSKVVANPHWTDEDEFEVDDSIGMSDGEAQGLAAAAFQAAYEGHVGGSREYRLIRCVELGYEAR